MNLHQESLLFWFSIPSIKKVLLLKKNGLLYQSFLCNFNFKKMCVKRCKNSVAFKKFFLSQKTDFISIILIFFFIFNRNRPPVPDVQIYHFSLLIKWTK